MKWESRNRENPSLFEFQNHLVNCSLQVGIPSESSILFYTFAFHAENISDMLTCSFKLILFPNNLHHPPTGQRSLWVGSWSCSGNHLYICGDRSTNAFHLILICKESMIPRVQTHNLSFTPTLQLWLMFGSWKGSCLRW